MKKSEAMRMDNEAHNRVWQDIRLLLEGCESPQIMDSIAEATGHQKGLVYRVIKKAEDALWVKTYRNEIARTCRDGRSRGARTLMVRMSTRQERLVQAPKDNTRTASASDSLPTCSLRVDKPEDQPAPSLEAPYEIRIVIYGKEISYVNKEQFISRLMGTN